MKKMVKYFLLPVALTGLYIKPSQLPVSAQAPSSRDQAEAELLRRLYEQGKPSETELLWLLDSITRSRIMTGELQFNFGKVSGDNRIILIYAIQAMQSKFKVDGFSGLEETLKISNIFEEYPTLWFVLANKCMEAQQSQTDIAKMKSILLGSLSERRGTYAAFKDTQKKRGFFSALRARCASWLKAWPIKGRYKPAATDIERFGQAELFLEGNRVIRQLALQENAYMLKMYPEFWEKNINYYRKNPKDICRELGVILSRCAGRGVTFEKVRELLSKLAQIDGMTRRIIDNELVGRLPAKMKAVFKEQMGNLLEQEVSYNVVLDTTDGYVDVLGRLNEPSKKPVSAKIKSSGEIQLEGEGFDRFGRPLPTAAQTAEALKKQVEERLERQRQLQREMDETKGRTVLDEPLEPRARE